MAEELQQFNLPEKEEQYLTEEDARALLGSFVTDLLRTDRSKLVVDIQTFNTAGTWTKPAGATGVRILARRPGR